MHLSHSRAGWFWPSLAASTALVGSAIPAAGQVYLTEAQALQVIFGQDASAKREAKNLTDAERKDLEASSGLHFPEFSYTFFVVQRKNTLAGYALVLDEIGKSEPITFMVGIDADGKVIDVAIMVFRETRGWEVKEKRFLRQFRGKRIGDPIQIDRDIINYSGATLSSKALARGVKRALLLLQTCYPPATRHARNSSGEFVMPAPLLALDITGEGDLALYRQVRYRMGTLCEIRLWARSSASAKAAIDAGFREIDRLNRIFSNYRDDSELAHVNALASTNPVDVSPEFWDLTFFAYRWWKRSRGTFDITVAPLLKAWGFWNGAPHVPSAKELSQAKALVGAHNLELLPTRRAIRFRRDGMELDFGGLAKGYTAERAAKVALEAGATSVLTNLGGSSLSAIADVKRMQALHANHEASSDRGLAVTEWPILISGANFALGLSRYLILSAGCSLSSSGSCEQSFRNAEGRMLCHIVDPRTGSPTEAPCAASVVARSGLLSEALTKRLLLLDISVSEAFTQLKEDCQWGFLQRTRFGLTAHYQAGNECTVLVPTI